MSGEMSESKRCRVAAITTVWRKDSHADVLISKLMAGYDLDGVPLKPSVDVVSLYVDQTSENDLSARWAARFGTPRCATIEEALTLGSGGLAVDAVLLVGEHGEYPWNEKGQHLYPRREFFEQAVAVMRRAGRAVPLFNDKHLSYAWEHARWMYDTAQELGMPFMAGSSLPVAYRDPDLELPLGCEIEEAVVLHPGPTESYGFHGLETLQCMVERRRGGETGVAAVELLHGEAFWRAWHDGRLPQELIERALATERDLPGESAPQFFAQRAAGRSATPGPQPPVAFLVQYRDGLRAAVINLNGYVKDWPFACRLRSGAVESTCVKLEGKPPRWHFNFLAHHVERFFLTGKAPYPVERTLLTTGTLAALMDSGSEGRRLDTPHLGVAYEAPPEPVRRSRGTSIPQEAVWGFRAEDV